MLISTKKINDQFFVLKVKILLALPKKYALSAKDFCFAFTAHSYLLKFQNEKRKTKM